MNLTLQQKSSRIQMADRGQSILNHFSRSNIWREQMEIGQKVVEQELETDDERGKSRALTIISRQEHGMFLVRIRLQQSLSWNWLLHPCSLHSLNQHLFSQQLQPVSHDSYRSLPTWDTPGFYDHLCPILLVLQATCDWVTSTLPCLSSLRMNALKHLQYTSLWKKLFNINYLRK